MKALHSICSDHTNLDFKLAINQAVTSRLKESCTCLGIPVNSQLLLVLGRLRIRGMVSEVPEHKEQEDYRVRFLLALCSFCFSVQRFLPSEFGLDPLRMEYALEPGKVSFDEKMIVRKAIQDAKIPFTYVCGAAFAGYFAGNLGLMGTVLPPKENVLIYGDGNSKVTLMDEDDIATYTIKAIDDQRTLNKTLYLRPPENVLTQKQLVELWENLLGKKLVKITISTPDFLASMKGI